ncbi:MOSC domain-containing protein [Actinoplanes subglobosus]|uniref:MOSC domain-containing protein n=1 Tax=Actinoplanes subglobosus TaxID=1547892 RepID=A0ABV8J7H4_9ACTN
MQLVEIRRYPVKSLLGEVVEAAEADSRGLAGDRLWAVRDADGKFGSGKNTRRFRRMPGLFDLRAHTVPHAASAALPLPDAVPPGSSLGVPAGSSLGVPAGNSLAVPAGSSLGVPAGSSLAVPLVELPDGRRFAADDPVGHQAISDHLGRPVTLAPEATVLHHDEGPVSLITTAALRALTGLAGPESNGAPVDPLRFRANLLLDVPGVGFPEDDWTGRRLRIGPGVVLRVVRPLTRCAMIDMAQEQAPERRDLLKALAEHNDMTFGVFATVEQPGHLTVGDTTAWI